MSLVNALKRKVDRLNTQPLAKDNPDTNKSRSRLEESDVTPELIASLRSKKTKTAQQKLRQAEAILKQQKRAARAEARAKLEQENGDAGHQNGAAVVDSDDDVAPVDPATVGNTAYEALLASLQNSSEAYAEAYHQRQKELAGDSGESESEEEDDDDLYDSDLAGNEDQADEEEDIYEEANGQAGNEDLKLDNIDMRDRDAIESDSGGDDDSDAASSNDDEDEEKPSTKSLKGKARTKQNKTPIKTQQNGAKTKSAVADSGTLQDEYTIDSFSLHFDRELTEDQIATLASAPPEYQDLLPLTPNSNNSNNTANPLQAWLPGATLQLSQRLPQTAATSQQVSVHGTLAEYGVKERLVALWREVALSNKSNNTAATKNTSGTDNTNKNNKNKVSSSSNLEDFVNDQQRALFAVLSSYKDVLLPNRPYPISTDAPDPELDAVLLHALNHCLRTADKVKKNNEKLEKASKSGSPLQDVPRDQGFTRPKVLILLPMRNIALRTVTRLLQLAIKETRTDSIKHKQRFLDDFGDEQEEELSAKAQAAAARKPPEHRVLFDGNLDDHFRLGIKLTRGAVRLYTDFFQSDIIVASPLALATKISEAAKQSGGSSSSSSSSSIDFLSSIELLVMDRTDVMLMQNWSHVLTVLNALNTLPKEQHDVDIMRVREWYLSGQARCYRQTIMMGSVLTPELNAVAGRVCVNASGTVRLFPEHEGVLGKVIPQAKQLFERLPLSIASSSSNGSTKVSSSSSCSDPDARFEYFKTKVWPRIREAAHGGGQLLYIPSYFDFVRVRNYLKSEAASFLALSEYTDRGDAARARSLFADGRKRVLLYTERAQFYNRHRIRGIKDIFFYQLPEHPQFYSDLVNFMEEASGPGVEVPTVNVLFSKLDGLRLSRVVGSKRSGKMVKKGAAGTFMFC